MKKKIEKILKELREYLSIKGPKIGTSTLKFEIENINEFKKVLSIISKYKIYKINAEFGYHTTHWMNGTTTFPYIAIYISFL